MLFGRFLSVSSFCIIRSMLNDIILHLNGCPPFGQVKMHKSWFFHNGRLFSWPPGLSIFFFVVADKFGTAMALVKSDIGGNISVCSGQLLSLFLHVYLYKFFNMCHHMLFCSIGCIILLCL